MHDSKGFEGGCPLFLFQNKTSDSYIYFHFASCLGRNSGKYLLFGSIESLKTALKRFI